MKNTKGVERHMKNVHPLMVKDFLEQKQEKSYLVDIESSCATENLNLLEWWSKNRLQYPNIAVVSCKWLSVVTTSTPSERVFSICGVVDSARRSKMTGESIQKQVFLHNNYYKVYSNQSDQ